MTLALRGDNMVTETMKESMFTLIEVIMMVILNENDFCLILTMMKQIGAVVII